MVWKAAHGLLSHTEGGPLSQNLASVRHGPIPPPLRRLQKRNQVRQVLNPQSSLQPVGHQRNG